MKLGFSRQIFGKYRNIKFYKFPCSWCQIIPWKRADG